MDKPFYTQRDQRIAEQSVQLLQHGKSFAVTGPSGAGKSILVQHLLSRLDANYYHGLHRNVIEMLILDGIIKALEKLNLNLQGADMEINKSPDDMEPF